MQAKRPVYLNLVKIKLPLPGIVSILHRVSGALLFLLIPFLLYLLQASLDSQESYEQFQYVTSHPLVKLVLIGLLWGFLHHFCAGIRYLALDLHWGIKLEQARSSSRWVMVVSIVLTIILGVAIW